MTPFNARPSPLITAAYAAQRVAGDGAGTPLRGLERVLLWIGGILSAFIVAYAVYGFVNWEAIW